MMHLSFETLTSRFHFAYEFETLEYSHTFYTPWSVLQDGSIVNILPTSRDKKKWLLHHLPYGLVYKVPRSLSPVTLAPIYNSPFCKETYLFGQFIQRNTESHVDRSFWKSKPGQAQTKFPNNHSLFTIASLLTISGPILLYFQSSFHLSITLLVRYRSPAVI